MATTPQRPKVLVIVGPTASGKSELAMKIAKNYDGEIIAADSRTIYKGMDIGTAKPTKHEQAEVPHWGIDLVEPGQSYSAARFKEYALAKIEEAISRAKLPILVGGTGLYIDGVVFDFNFLPPVNLVDREELEKLSIEKLQALVKKKDYLMPTNQQNRRHLIRTLERRGKQGSKNQTPKEGLLVAGLMPQEFQLKERISNWVEGILKAGVITETKSLVARYGEEAVLSSGGFIYKICLGLLKGEVSESETIELLKTADWQYARRQRTWFRRNPHITWFESPATAYKAVSKALNT